MIEFMKAWVINITVIIIFITLLEIMLPNGDSKRFIRVIAGLLTILVIVKPFVYSSAIKTQFNDKIIATASYIDQSTAQDLNKEIAKYQNTEAINLYKEKMTKHIKEAISIENNLSADDIAVELEIDNDLSSKDFGKIKNVSLSVTEAGGPAIETAGIQVSPVRIDKIGPTPPTSGSDSENKDNLNKTVMNRDNSEYTFSDSKLTKRIQDRLSDMLGVHRSKVTVNVKK